MKQELFYNEYDVSGYIVRTAVDKIVKDGEVVILVRNPDKAPYSVINYIKYKDIGYEVASWSRLNWKNLILCSNNYSVAPDYEYMHSAVQNGLKPACSAYVNRDGARKLQKRLPDNCKILPYRGNDHSIWWICMGGRLSDFIDFDTIQRAYNDHGLWYQIDWDKLRPYFDMPFEDFAVEGKCPIDIHDGGGAQDYNVIRGLVLGYPVESTVAYIKTGCTSACETDMSKTADWRREDIYI